MTTKTFAYVRVSSKNENIDRQIYVIDEYCEINKIKVDEWDIYIDKISGKDFNRESYQALKLVLREGDTLIAKELDRLGRNKNPGYRIVYSNDGLIYGTYDHYETVFKIGKY